MGPATVIGKTGTNTGGRVEGGMIDGEGEGEEREKQTRQAD